jgi:hypothetical protein
MYKRTQVCLEMASMALDLSDKWTHSAGISFRTTVVVKMISKYVSKNAFQTGKSFD